MMIRSGTCISQCFEMVWVQMCEECGHIQFYGGEQSLDTQLRAEGEKSQSSLKHSTVYI